MNIERTIIQPKYKEESGVWVLNTQTAPFPDGFSLQEQTIVYLPPKQMGGNHKHPRTELFIGIGNGMQLYWQDEEEEIHTEQMNPDGRLQLFVIPSHMPHAVRNESDDTSGILYEYADSEQHDVVEVHLI